MWGKQQSLDSNPAQLVSKLQVTKFHIIVELKIRLKKEAKKYRMKIHRKRERVY